MKTFVPIFFSGFILFLEASTKFTMTKISETQVPSIHAYADIKQCLHISKVYENIHDQKTNKNIHDHEQHILTYSKHKSILVELKHILT